MKGRNRYRNRHRGGGGQDIASDFTFSVKTDNAGVSNDYQFKIPLRTGETYDCVIDWGDDSTTSQTTDVSPTHTYSALGTYTIKISGAFPAIYFNNSGDKRKITSVTNWGSSEWTKLNGSFRGCSKITSITSVSNMSISSVTDLTQMFHGCSSLATLDLSGLVPANATHLTQMFRDCSSLTTLDLSGFVTDNVAYMSRIFRGCSSLDVDVSGFNIAKLADATEMFLSSAFSTANYNLLLVAWEAQSERSGVPFHAGTAQYSTGAPATARAALVSNSWTITDGGAA